jgi:hypothetical protein
VQAIRGTVSLFKIYIMTAIQFTRKLLSEMVFFFACSKVRKHPMKGLISAEIKKDKLALVTHVILKESGISVKDFQFNANELIECLGKNKVKVV